MEELNNKLTGNSLTAAEWNQQPSELQNIITDFGQVLSGADLNQVGKSIAGYVANGNFYNAGGTVDVITLSVIGSRQGVLDYSDGMEVAFFPVGNNTGVSLTVEIGILGAVDLTYTNGNTPKANELDAGRISVAKYDSANARFVLMNNFGRGGAAGEVLLSAAIDSTLGVQDHTAATPSAVKAAFDLATNTLVDSDNGYFRNDATGWTLQWGTSTQSFTETTQNVLVNFPIAFSQPTKRAVVSVSGVSKVGPIHYYVYINDGPSASAISIQFLFGLDTTVVSNQNAAIKYYVTGTS